MPQNNFPWTGAEAPTWDDIREKPAVIAEGETEADARAAIGVGNATADDAGLVKLAAHVDPATGTVEEVVNALIAAGVMAAA